MAAGQDCFSFGQFQLDTGEHILRREGTVVALPPKALDLLIVLVQNGGRLLGKEELMKLVWPDTFVEDNNLTVHISLLRKTLGESYIDTVPRRGYRFTAPVSVAGATVIHELTRTTVVVEEQTSSSRRAWMLTAGGMATLASVGAGAWFWIRSRQPKESTIAVLPFRSIGGAPEIGMGLADSLITRLAGMDKVNVRPTAFIRRYADGNRDPVEAGRQLRVDSVLDGSVQQEGNQLRLSVQLIQVSDGKQLWGQTFDREFRGIFAIEDEISTQVARALSSTLRVSGSLASRRTSNAEAYRLYLMGRHLIWQHNLAPIRQGIQLEEESVAKDPGFAPAHCSIALGYLFLIQLGAINLREATAKMSAAASKALELDDRLAEAHALMGGVRGIDDYDWTGCKRECRRALELDPDDMIGLDGRATQAIVMGQFDEAYKDRVHIRDLDPTVPLNHLGVCWPLMYAGRQEAALVHIRRSLELDPAFARGHQALATVYRLQGKSAESVTEELKAAELSGGDPAIAAQLRTASLAGGMAGYDRKRLDLALSRPKPSSFNLANIYRDLGDYGKSMDYLEKSYEEHPLGLIWIKTFPPWKPMHEFPRFGALLKRMGLEPPTLV